jgi:ferric-dicitrate binding protein FerR (iron transport regulator)
MFEFVTGIDPATAEKGALYMGLMFFIIGVAVVGAAIWQFVWWLVGMAWRSFRSGEFAEPREVTLDSELRVRLEGNTVVMPKHVFDQMCSLLVHFQHAATTQNHEESDHG